MRLRGRSVVGGVVVGLVSAGVLASTGTASAAPPGSGTSSGAGYDHMTVIVEENHGFSDVIGNPAAPNLNALATTYGVATNYYGVTHPSEPNYVAMLGGSTFGVANDNPYFLNKVDQPSLISQLDAAHVGWKAYLQSSPHAGYQGVCYPAYCNGTPDKDPLYVSKHNPIPNFTTSWNPQDWSRQVPADQLAADLRADRLPAFSLLIPDECHDQHGDPPYCVDSGTPKDAQDQRLVATGDAYLGEQVARITRAPSWNRGNNAIVVVYDEGTDGTGPGGSAGGGKVATVVITSHGPRHVQDATAYNHYSLLKTLQSNFGLSCLAHSCDPGVTTLDPLLHPSGTPATSWQPRPVPNEPTPTPTPSEPVTTTPGGQSSAGWTVQPSPQRGTGDNSLGAVSAAGPDDVWAVGNYLPDANGSNPDATLSLAAHFDGTRWTSTPTVNSGPNFTTLFGVAATGNGRAWAVGDALDSSYAARSVIEHFDGTTWSLAPAPRLAGQRDMLFAAAAAGPDDVWAVGQQQNAPGVFGTLIEHYDGHRWTVVPSPDPGTAGNGLFAVTVAPDHQAWAVGQRNDATSDTPLVEHWDGHHWSLVPGAPHVTGLLDAVTAGDGQVWAAGRTDDAQHTAQPIVVPLTGTKAGSPIALSGADRPVFADLLGIAVERGTVWATGTIFDPSGTYDGSPGGVQRTLVARLDGDHLTRVAAPDPGTADRVLGGMVDTGRQLVSVGYYKMPSGRVPLIETHPLS